MSGTNETLPTIDQLVPHRGAMSLLDEITGYGDDWLESRARITGDNLFLTRGQVPSWVGLEYMAQTAAAFMGVGREPGTRARIGFLAGTRKYQTQGPAFVPGSELRVRVQRLGEASGGLLMLEATLTCQPPEGEAFSANARLTIYEPDDSRDSYGEP